MIYDTFPELDLDYADPAQRLVATAGQDRDDILIDRDLYEVSVAECPSKNLSPAQNKSGPYVSYCLVMERVEPFGCP